MTNLYFSLIFNPSIVPSKFILLLASKDAFIDFQTV